MNAKICEKCLERYIGRPIKVENNETVVFSFTKDRDGSDLLMVSWGSKFFYKNTFCKTRIALYCGKDFSDLKENLEDISLKDKKCPYWLEHQMFDWNRNES